MTSDITTHTTTPPTQISLSEPSPLSVRDMIFECPLKLFNITYFNALTKCNKCVIQMYYTKKLTEVIESIFFVSNFRNSEIRSGLKKRKSICERCDWRRSICFDNVPLTDSQSYCQPLHFFFRPVRISEFPKFNTKNRLSDGNIFRLRELLVVPRALTQASVIFP